MVDRNNYDTVLEMVLAKIEKHHNYTTNPLVKTIVELSKNLYQRFLDEQNLEDVDNSGVSSNGMEFKIKDYYHGEFPNWDVYIIHNGGGFKFDSRIFGLLERSLEE